MKRVVHRPAQRSLAARAAAVMMAGGVALAAVPARAAGPGSIPSYAVIDLNPLSRDATRARGFNSLGQVVGEAGPAGGGYAFLWANGKLTALWAPGRGVLVDARGINDAGQIVGTQTAPDLSSIRSRQAETYVLHASLDEGLLSDLGTVGGGRESGAVAINAAGHVVGGSEAGAPVGAVQAEHAFLADSKGVHDLGTVAGLAYSSAMAINASDQVIGCATNKGNLSRAFLWQKGVMRDLGTLGGSGSGAFGLNDAGQVVGTTLLPGDTAFHAFFYDATGMHDLGTLPGDSSRFYAAWSINNLGQIVGTASSDGFATGRGFFATGSVMVDLNGLLLTKAPWSSFEPVAINDHQQIIGNGLVGGQMHAFLLNPIAAPFLTVSAAALTFSSTAATQTLTLANTGGAPLALQGVTLSGSDAGSFQIAGGGPATLAPGASRTVTVTFSSAGAGSRSASLMIRDNDPHPGSPRQVPLTAVVTAPAAPTNLAATAVSAGEVDLTWTSGAGGETGVSIFRTDSSRIWQRIGVVSPLTTSFVDRSVLPQTSYFYAVRTHNDTQVSAWTNEAAATTPKGPPAAPSHLTATIASPTEIDLAWAVGGGNETGISIFRRGPALSGWGDWQRIGVVSPRATSYVDRSAQPGTSYSYRLRSHNDTQVSAWTNEAGVVTPAAP